MQRKLMALSLALLLCLTGMGCEKQKATDPGQLQTPQYSVATPTDFAPPPEDEIHTAENGVKVIAPADTALAANVAPQADASTERSTAAAQPAIPAAIPVTRPVTPETVWENDAVVTYNAFTLPEKAAFDNGSIGVLSIAKIGLAVNVYESDSQMEDMEKGIAHFKSTSAWDGNCALSGHNSTASGYGAYFKDLHLLAVGDTITYSTALGEREYKVTAVKTISDEDWNWLTRTADNRLTLITCTFTDASKRLMVQASQV